MSLRALGVVLMAAALLAVLVPAARAELTSTKVAYVYDPALVAGTGEEVGMNDPSLPGGSIFTDAVGVKVGTKNEGHYTPTGGSEVTLKNVTLEELDANSKLLEEGGYDTAILYQTCSIASHAGALSEINAFLNSAHKVMIFDADGCSPQFGALGEPNWSGFVFPFTTNNPGPLGERGFPYTIVEPSSLTAGLSVGSQENDAVGDANVFTSSSPAWFQAIAGTNSSGEKMNGVTGTIMAYARTASGGLALYEGEDFWFTDEPDAHLKLVFDDMLNQHWNPDHLPDSTSVCRSCAPSEVTTKLSSTVDPEGLAIFDSATIKGLGAAGTATGKVTFTIYSDPSCTLPVAGQAQTVTVATGAAITTPITLPPGTYYFRAQYSGDDANFPGISSCGAEVLTVVPAKPPREVKKPVVLPGAEVEWEVEVPEPGTLEFEGEGPGEAELARAHQRTSALAFAGASLVQEIEPLASAAKKKKCKKGFAKKHGKCLSRAPLHFSKGKLTITTAGIYKLRFKATGKLLTALKKGKKPNVSLIVTLTPAQTTVQRTLTAKVKLSYFKKKKHHGKKK